MRKVIVAATQMSCSWDLDKNISKAEKLVKASVESGANIILLQELFETPYFCQTQKYEYLKLAKTLEESRVVNHFKQIAKNAGVVLPISFFEKCNNTAFNSVAVIDSDGSVLGIYRKTHIPDGHCYEEKFYFTPGNTGFKVWDTKFAKIGVGICWDQWFCESARCMALQGAEILLYPSTIGSEPVLNTDSRLHWQRVIQGHAAANIMPLVVSNRIGTQKEGDLSMTFYGLSFIAGMTGEIVKQLGEKEEGYIISEFDIDEINDFRRSWGIFRDRIPYMYKNILSFGE
ncbi:MAG: N-carbamoylputrescine amidase [Endomicrobium sp.]|jgi:N-carbamoylputrescine amidase|nr:N-carbamoylputrescine amidase [Endomicrobium sp.]